MEVNLLTRKYYRYVLNLQKETLIRKNWLLLLLSSDYILNPDVEKDIRCSASLDFWHF
jgi:hypothetical protein